jgi:hypothetical protein
VISGLRKTYTAVFHERVQLKVWKQHL